MSSMGRDEIDAAIAKHRGLAASRRTRLGELDAQLAQPGADEAKLKAERAQVDAELQAGLAELAGLEKLLRQTPAESVEVDVEQSLEAQTLDRVRGHIADVLGQDTISDELAGRPPEVTPPPARPTREEADEAARRQFEELRNRAQGKPGKKT
jgi:hypothetical protein